MNIYAKVLIRPGHVPTRNIVHLDKTKKQTLMGSSISPVKLDLSVYITSRYTREKNIQVKKQ